jgi:1-acyl-sn-glycerol-3-phosphate acyltransferase
VPVGEHAHYKVPGWRDALSRWGAVRGTRDNVHELMRQRETILVFPGGAREVNKRKGEKYQLIWKERLGFARLAIAHGYQITPFAAVVRGIGPTMLPRPQRLYFWFGEPVATAPYGGASDDDGAARAVRDEVKAAVEGGIAFLLAEREDDPQRGLIARLTR